MLLILTPNYLGEASVLGKTAALLGWEIYRAQSSWRLPDLLIGREGAVYGELYFCEAVAQQMHWTLNNNKPSWLAALPKEYVKRNVSFTTLAAARHINEKKFIKPVDGKVFPASVYDNGNQLPQQAGLDDIPVLVSEKIKFQSEYRCFVKDREVVSVSCYAHYKAPINDPYNWYVNTESVVSFVNAMLKDDRVSCVPGASIDVGRLKNEELAVIDAGPAYASDIYGCERVGTLDAIKASCNKD